MSTKTPHANTNVHVSRTLSQSPTSRGLNPVYLSFSHHTSRLPGSATSQPTCCGNRLLPVDHIVAPVSASSSLCATVSVIVVART
jgi:hypothetical protein